MKLREYFLSVRLQLEEYIDHLKSQLEQVKTQLNVAKSEAEKLPGQDDLQRAVRVLETELQEVDRQVNTFSSEVTVSGPDGRFLSLADGPSSEDYRKWLNSYWVKQRAGKKEEQ